MVIVRCGSMFDGEHFASEVELTLEGRVITGVTSGSALRVGLEGAGAAAEESSTSVRTPWFCPGSWMRTSTWCGTARPIRCLG